jgi:hypothetical protein
MSSLIFKQPALNPGQRFFAFTLVLTPANALHSSFLIPVKGLQKAPHPAIPIVWTHF